MLYKPQQHISIEAGKLLDSNTPPLLFESTSDSNSLTYTEAGKWSDSNTLYLNPAQIQTLQHLLMLGEGWIQIYTPPHPSV